MADNLVLYNLDRLKRMVTRFVKDKGEFSYPGEDYDSILHTMEFVKGEMERNYNPNADLECGWRGCKERFRGWKAHDRLIRHQVKKHSDKVQAEMVAVAGVMAICINSLGDPNWLVGRTNSRAAQEVAKLKRKGKDIPITLLQEYYADHDAYMDSVDPDRRWHKPIHYSPPEGIDHMLGRNSLVKETVRGIRSALRGGSQRGST